MGLLKYKPLPSDRMGILWTLATIKNAALIEFGCMGHMLYGRVFLNRAGVLDSCKLYSTHIDETDIALGGIERFRRTISEISERDKPRVIFLTPSAVPEIIGVDLNAVCEELQPEFPDIKLISFGYGGFDVTANKAVQETLFKLCSLLSVKREKTKLPTFNIIGSCADIYKFKEDSAEIKRLLKGAFGMEPLCIMTSDTSVEDIENMSGAHINIVIREEGEKCAKYMENKCGIPYFLGRPYGIKGTKAWLEEIAKAAEFSPDENFINKEIQYAMSKIMPIIPYFRHMSKMHPDELVFNAGGHGDVVGGILSFACNEAFFNKGICWCDSPDMRSDELPYYSESEWEPALKSFEKGIFMGSGEALDIKNHSRSLQIANPDSRWNISAFGEPHMGFRGAVKLIETWINEIKLH